MRFALVGAGSVGKSFLPDLPRLALQLGPVAASSARLASRIANTLRAGTAVKSLDELKSSRTILLCGSRGAVERITAELLATDLVWRGKALLLCDFNVYSGAIVSLQERGAAVGSLNKLGDSAEKFVIEGDPAALQTARYLVRELKGRAVEMQRDKMASFGAALTFSSSLFTPLIESCVECLKVAGVPGASARPLAVGLFQNSLRAFLHTGRRGWFGAVALGNREAVEKEVEGLRESKPLLAEYYRMSVTFALQLYEQYPELADPWELPPVPTDDAGAPGIL